MHRRKTILAALLLCVFAADLAFAQRSRRSAQADDEQQQALRPPQLEQPGKGQSILAVGVLVLIGGAVVAAAFYPAPRQHDD